jgi:hypothetical protein
VKNINKTYAKRPQESIDLIGMDAIWFLKNGLQSDNCRRSSATARILNAARHFLRIKVRHID